MKYLDNSLKLWIGIGFMILGLYMGRLDIFLISMISVTISTILMIIGKDAHI